MMVHQRYRLLTHSQMGWGLSHTMRHSMWLIRPDRAGDVWGAEHQESCKTETGYDDWLVVICLHPKLQVSRCLKVFLESTLLKLPNLRSARNGRFLKSEKKHYKTLILPHPSIFRDLEFEFGSDCCKASSDVSKTWATRNAQNTPSLTWGLWTCFTYWQDRYDSMHVRAAPRSSWYDLHIYHDWLYTCVFAPPSLSLCLSLLFSSLCLSSTLVELCHVPPLNQHLNRFGMAWKRDFLSKHAPLVWLSCHGSCYLLNSFADLSGEARNHPV